MDGVFGRTQAGDCSLFLDFLKNITCAKNEEHYEYLLDVMADTVQRPNKQGEVAVVLRGEEGVGKGCTVKNFGMIFGHHYLPVTQASQITGKFNGHLTNCVVLFADEHSMPGISNMRQHLRRLSPKATSWWSARGWTQYRPQSDCTCGSVPTLTGLSLRGRQRADSFVSMSPIPASARPHILQQSTTQ